MRKILSKKVSEVMTRKVVTLKPEDTISKVKELFMKHKFNAFPVVDSKGKFLGLVSKIDFLKIFAMGITISRSSFYNQWAKNVSEIMITSVKPVGPDSELIDAANLMVEYRYRTVPVIDKNQKLVGIITASDITKYTLLELEKKSA
jgi:acetoin utilization protein AcuB